MSFLLSLLLTPFVPQMEDPQVLYSQQLAGIVRELEKDNQPAKFDSSELSELDKPEPAKPAEISGRILKDQVDPKAQTASSTSSTLAVGWRLLGIVKVGRERVALINDGQKDHLVGTGSYVDGEIKVAAIEDNSVLLKGLKPNQGDPVRLQIQQSMQSEGEQ